MIMVWEDPLLFEQGIVAFSAVRLGYPDGFYLAVSRTFPLIVDPAPEIGPPRSSSFENVCSLFTYNTIRIPVTSSLAAVCINFLLP